VTKLEGFLTRIITDEMINIAKEMLLDGEPITKIKKYTKLTEKEIKELRAELKENE